MKVERPMCPCGQRRAEVERRQPDPPFPVPFPYGADGGSHKDQEAWRDARMAWDKEHSPPAKCWRCWKAEARAESEALKAVAGITPRPTRMTRDPLPVSWDERLRELIEATSR